MPIFHVESIDDPQIAVYRDLPTSRRAERSGLFVVEGRLLVDRLIASDYEVDSLLVEARYSDDYETCAATAPVWVVPHGMIEQIIGFNFHRGVLGCGRRRAARPLSDLVPPGTPSGMAVVAVDVRDPENLGGLLRNCAAFGVRLVLLSRECADPFSRRVMRVSMGTNLTLDVCRPHDLRADLLYLRDTCQWDLIATVLDRESEPLAAAERLYPPRLNRQTSNNQTPNNPFGPSPHAEWPRGMALLFGCEGHGLSAEWISLCPRRVTIPMRAGTDSLNVAVASGIFLYHFTAGPDDDLI